MATRIPYLDEVWNVTTGCGDDMVSPGCEHCYARRMFGRHLWKCPEYHGDGLVWRDLEVPGLKSHEHCPTCHGTGKADFTPTFHADRLDQPLHWRKPRRVGVSFMGDWAHPAFSDSQIMNIFGVMLAAPQHEYLFLTKRPERQKHLLQLAHDSSSAFRDGKVRTWAGATVCNQPEADHHTPIILDTPAAVRWVSYEPAIAPVDFRPYLCTHDCEDFGLCQMDPAGKAECTYPKLDLIVLGGETGPGARRMHARWAVDVWKQCRAAGVPFYWKQAGSAWLAGDGTDDDDDSAVLDCRELPAVTP